MTKSEKVLWNQIRNDRLGFRFRRQHPIGPYVLDFYCAAVKLCVEVDGPMHSETQARDFVRDEYLLKLGILTVRIPTCEFYENEGPGVFEWADRIKAICVERLR